MGHVFCSITLHTNPAVEMPEVCLVCVAPYCSLGCYKSHKEVCGGTERTAGSDQHYVDTGPTGLTSNTDSDFARLFPTANTIPQDKLQLLDKSDKLREILFLEFVDVCLNAPNPERGRELTD